ncbi:DUF1059 domain-containing protein [Patescibacteria group bacterium]
MKTMTCKQLYGPCDEEFHAETVEEMIQLSQKHGMKMAEKGDEIHIEVMKKMKNSGGDPAEYMAKTKAIFDALPEDK